VSPWRDQVAAAGLADISRRVKAHGLELSGYCRGGMFTATDDAGLKAADDDNRRAVDEARELNASCLVLVVGALPGALAGKAAHKDLALSRQQVHDGIGRLLEHSRAAGMPLAIEPLHPMYAADRACINTLEQALDVCDALDPSRSGALGVAVDVYHVWWDPKLQAQIQRAGRQRLLAFHVCDWLTPTTDLLNDRGMMGDGVIDIPRIRGWVEGQGFAGYSEVEIFSTGNWWQREAGETLDTCIERHRSAV
jgi:sugar phosphate isomerase/epimerase